MSNRLAIAAVTATLQDLLTVAAAEVPGTAVIVGRPDSKRQAEPTPTINLFLFDVLNNPSLRNQHQPSRNFEGNLLDTPTAALDLHYLLTFTGRESALESQRLLGATIAALVEHPVLTPDDITRSMGLRDYLAGCDLATADDRVRLSPLHLSLEELSRLWSMLAQEPYAISLQYQASVVVVNPTVTPRRVEPVTVENITVSPIERRPR